jgi:hypothetical protein
VQYLNDPHPWIDGRDQELSMVDLVVNGTIAAGPAALLWWGLERGASLLAAGGPGGAGKSTLAHACLSFLPDGARAYAVAGRDDPLLVPAGDGPTYLLISELSRHGRPSYLSGAAARRAFALVRAGLRVVGTLHADSVDEAIANLGDEVELSPEDIASVALIAITRVEGWSAGSGPRRIARPQPGEAPVRRRVVEIGLLGPAPGRGVRHVTLAAWGAAPGRLEIAAPPAGIAALAGWAGVPTPAAAAAIAARADILARLAADGRRHPREVAEAVRLLRAA